MRQGAITFDPSELPSEDYAYLLGLYLGDGHLASFPRDVYKLTISCDALLGIRWTRPNEKLIAIDRRDEVAKLDEFVGPKY